jgi:hypothetical protein
MIGSWRKPALMTLLPSHMLHDLICEWTPIIPVKSQWLAWPGIYWKYDQYNSNNDILLAYLWSWALPEKLPFVWPFRKFPAILRNLKLHHRVHKRPPLVPILSQVDPVHTIPSYLSKSHFNIVHHHLGLPSGLFPSGFPTNILHAFLVSPIRATCPAISSSLTNYVWRRV